MGCLQTRNLNDSKDVYVLPNNTSKVITVQKKNEQPPVSVNNSSNKITVTDAKSSSSIVSQPDAKPAVTTQNPKANLQANNFRGSLKPKGSITNPDDFRLQLNDLVQEKQEKIGSVYNLLMPPIGKGKYLEVN
jgi:hypothetical protein